MSLSHRLCQRGKKNPVPSRRRSDIAKMLASTLPCAPSFISWPWIVETKADHHRTPPKPPLRSPSSLKRSRLTTLRALITKSKTLELDRLGRPGSSDQRATVSNRQQAPTNTQFQHPPRPGQESPSRPGQATHHSRLSSVLRDLEMSVQDAQARSSNILKVLGASGPRHHHPPLANDTHPCISATACDFNPPRCCVSRESEEGGCAEKKVRAESKVQAVPSFAQSVLRRLLVIPREAGNDGVEA